MKPFDLEKALAGGPVVTRDGQKVTQLTLFKAMTMFKLLGVVNDRVNSWTPEGKYSCGTISGLDLFMAPTRQTTVVEVWRVDNVLWSRIVPVADKSIGYTEHGRTLVHIQQIEWEE